MNKNEDQIKNAIVDKYRKGIVDHNGVTIPKEKRGMAGKGSHFRPAPTKAYRENFVKVFGDKHG